MTGMECPVKSRRAECEKTALAYNCSLSFDYYTGGSIRFHDVMDLMHYPKSAFRFYKSRSAADNYNGSLHPVLKTANRYTSASPVNRDVCHNREQVKLYHNGASGLTGNGPVDIVIFAFEGRVMYRTAGSKAARDLSGLGISPFDSKIAQVRSSVSNLVE
ncbi:MAG: hypothetical protein JW863_04270 [Chitinispirillaceae bacterium]|nr:hypothetical protein [Chitinispirillaceae bacterium]